MLRLAARDRAGTPKRLLMRCGVNRVYGLLLLLLLLLIQLRDMLAVINTRSLYGMLASLWYVREYYIQ